MSTRGLLAAAIAVLGVYYTGVALVQVTMMLTMSGPGWRDMAWLITPGLILGVSLLLARTALAKALALPSPGSEVATGTGLERVGICLLGIWFGAYGLTVLINDCLHTLLASAEAEAPGETFLQRNTGAMAFIAVGFVLLTGAPTIHRWLSRRS